MNDKELESMIYTYFENEVPEPNQQLLDDLKTQMHQKAKANSLPKRTRKKLHLVFVSCILIILIVPAITWPFLWNNFFPTDTSDEIYYGDSNLNMEVLSEETLSSILVGDFSRYATLLEGYTSNVIRGYYAENDVLVYVDIEMSKNSVPFTKAKLDIVFEENYVHKFNRYFEDINEFIQYENCKLYEAIRDFEYLKEYYKLFEFEDHKVYLQLDKQDSSIVNAIIQN